MKILPNALSAALILFVLSGCSSSIQPIEGSPDASTLRPKIIRLDSTDPCSLLTSAQLNVLDVGGGALAAPKERRGPTCQWSHASNEPYEGDLVEAHTMDGIQTTLANPLGIEHLTILDYPAIQTTGQGADPSVNCVVAVDVAPDQMLVNAYSYEGTTVSMTHEIACSKARLLAEMATQTLIQKSG